jgi:hypothetical protein
MLCFGIKNLLQTDEDFVRVAKQDWLMDYSRRAPNKASSGVSLITGRNADKMERYLKEFRFLKESHAEYEKQILAMLSQELAAKYDKGFKCLTLARTVRFVEAFLQQETVSTLSRQLSLSQGSVENA